MNADLAALDDRSILEVAGPEASDLLQRLVTNDVAQLGQGEARYAALLTPQGKILTDFLVVAWEAGTFLLDVPAANAADLLKKLTLYRLRAKVTIVDQSQRFRVVAFDAEPPRPAFIVYVDPRGPTLWRRAIVERDETVHVGTDAALLRYRDARIRAAVPEGGIDFAYAETFPHDANLDHLNGVDFRKGCYVGQEVVSRVQHRGTARKRVAKVTFAGMPPSVGSDLFLGDLVIGTMGSATDGVGLAMVRLDRIADTGPPVLAEGVVLHVEMPAWWHDPQLDRATGNP